MNQIWMTVIYNTLLIKEKKDEIEINYVCVCGGGGLFFSSLGIKEKTRICYNILGGFKKWCIKDVFGCRNVKTVTKSIS